MRCKLGGCSERTAFLSQVAGVKSWLNKMLGSTATELDFQIRMQSIWFQKFGINYLSHAWVISASQSTATSTYDAFTQILPISETSTVGFIGYNALNFATKEDYESIAQYYSMEIWLLTTCRTTLMHEFNDVDTPLLLQVKTTTFRNFMLESVDQSGNCLMLDVDYYTTMGKPVMIFPIDNEQAAYNRAKELNSLILKEYNGQALKSFSMKQVWLGGATTVKDRQAVNALLSWF